MISDENGTLAHLLQKILSLQEQTSAQLIESQLISQEMFWLSLYSGEKTILESQQTFWSAYPKASGDLRLIQTANLFLLESLQHICQANNLIMWLSGGTLIGALRHKGFIPWDDDVDVGIMRGDFEKLKKLLLNTDLCIKEYYHDTCCAKGYQFCYADGRIPNFIDITPFDYCNCNSSTERQAFLEEFRVLRHEMESRYFTELGAPKCIDIGYSHFGPYYDHDKLRVDALISEYQKKLCTANGNCLFYGIDNYPFGYPVMPIESIIKVQFVPFESTLAMVPTMANEYLQGYGDIWQLPKDIGFPSHLYAFIPSISKIRAFVDANTIS